MIHLGKNTTSRIISKGIAAGVSQNTYRGLVTAHRKATGARNFTDCDSLLIGDKCGAHTVPYIEAKNSSALFEHEATTSKISEDVLFYCVQRGLVAGRGGRARRQRFRQGRAAAAADGIRGRGAEADLDRARRIGWISRHPRCLRSKPRRMRNMRTSFETRRKSSLRMRNEEDVSTRSQKSARPCRRREILNGLSLTVNKGEVHAIMGPNGSGKSTLTTCIAGKPDYEVTDGEMLFEGEDLLEMSPDERSAKGVFLAFQYPVEIPGVATMTFLRTALNAQRKARGESEFSRRIS